MWRTMGNNVAMQPNFPFAAPSSFPARGRKPKAANTCTVKASTSFPSSGATMLVFNAASLSAHLSHTHTNIPLSLPPPCWEWTHEDTVSKGFTTDPHPSYTTGLRCAPLVQHGLSMHKALLQSPAHWNLMKKWKGTHFLLFPLSIQQYVTCHSTVLPRRVLDPSAQDSLALQL